MPPPNQPLIAASNLSFAYAGEAILANVSFQVSPGEMVALIGANGSGKSTLVKLLLGELDPCQGAVSLFGHPPRQFRDWSRLGYVPQRGLTSVGAFPANAVEVVEANLFAQVGLLRSFGKAERQKALAALAQYGLADQAYAPLATLSGGQMQRLLLARAMVNDPALLILDEPTTGIDPQSVAAFYADLAQLNKTSGLTILMVTHDLLRATQVVHRGLQLRAGHLDPLDHAGLCALCHHPLRQTPEEVVQ